MADTDTAAVRNGIDLATLGEVATEILGSTEPAVVAIRTEHHWTDAARVAGRGSTVQVLGEAVDRTHHELASDLPPLLGGRDTAPAPTEVLLAALAGCVVSGLAEQAAFEGVDLDRVDVTADTSIDIRGAFGADGVRVAPASITLTVTVDGDAEAAQLEDLTRRSLALSPTAAALSQPVPVHLVVRAR
jgi:uncharacterized OsmC-like protein